MTEDTPPPHGPGVEETFKRGGEWYGKDEHGEFKLSRGRSDPPPWDYDQPRCGAIVKFTNERYGEVRYCTGITVGHFKSPNYDRPEFCRHHQQRGYLMDIVEENYKTGAAAKSYKTVYQFLPPHKQIVAIDLYYSLMEQSTHNFDERYVDFVIDASESDVFDVDEIPVDFPIPTAKTAQCKALWFASLDFVRMQDIHEEQFRVGAEEVAPKSGRPLAIGEKAFEKETESGETVEIVDEHHLNLPLSRIQKDYERHLKFGGVDVDQTSDDDGPEMTEREWVIEVQPESSDPAPEATKERDLAPIEDEPALSVEPDEE